MLNKAMLLMMGRGDKKQAATLEITAQNRKPIGNGEKKNVYIDGKYYTYVTAQRFSLGTPVPCYIGSKVSVDGSPIVASYSGCTHSQSTSSIDITITDAQASVFLDYTP